MNHDLIVIGAGPGGYVAAIRAAQLGLNVACVEKTPALGGTCLQVGCIPSKALLESSALFEQAKSLGEFGVRVRDVDCDLPAMLQRKNQIVASLTAGIGSLFAKHKITRYQGGGRLAGGGRVVVAETGGERRLEGKHIIIATGSLPAPLSGVSADAGLIDNSTDALAYDRIPEHLVVVGAGYIGLELGTVWRRLGAKVTVLEYFDRILPGADAEIADEARKLFQKQGLEFRLKARVTGVVRDDQGRLVTCEGSEPIHCDRVLAAVGRVPNTRNLNLDAAGVACDATGRITVNARFETSAVGVYAIGDVIAGPMLAHKAEDEAMACVEQIVTGYGHVNYNTIPGVVYTEPEIAAVGKTEEQLKEAAVNYRKGVFPFRANGRARALGHTEGWVKILADSATDRVLGVHIIGPRAGDLIAEAVAAMEFGASSEDVARCCHAHPTLAEALKEAALAVDRRAIHF